VVKILIPPWLVRMVLIYAGPCGRQAPTFPEELGEDQDRCYRMCGAFDSPRLEEFWGLRLLIWAKEDLFSLGINPINQRVALFRLRVTGIKKLKMS
jgi:hypothetical protein